MLEKEINIRIKSSYLLCLILSIIYLAVFIYSASKESGQWMHPTDLGDYFILFYGTLIYVGLGIVSFFSTILLLMQIKFKRE